MEMLTLPSHNSYNKDIFGIYVLGDHGGRYKAAPPPFYLPIPERQTEPRIIHSTGRPQWFPIKIPMSSDTGIFLYLH